MTSLTTGSAALSVRPKTHIEKMTPALPEQIYMLSPGDVHLGASNRCGALIEILSTTECQMLVLNGDLLETSSLKRLLKNLSKQDRELLRLIDKKHQTGMRVVYVLGNHDKDVRVLLTQVAALLQEGKFAHGSNEHDVLEALSLIGKWEMQELLLHEYREMKFVHAHGDQWDHIVRGKRASKVVAKLGAFFWDILKRIDREKHKVATFTKRRVKLLTKISDQVAAGAIALAKEHSAHYALAGHTHDPWEFSLDGIRYVNAGGFDMYESGLVSIDTSGNVLLHKVHARSKKINTPQHKKKP